MAQGTVKWFNAEKASALFHKKTGQTYLLTFQRFNPTDSNH